MSKIISFLFNLSGWKVSGDIPRHIKKYLIAAAPHTSNWDFFVGLGARATIGLKASFLGKEELFRPPFGFIFRKLGGIPVKRSEKTEMVMQIAERFRLSESMVLALAPEGTRKKTNKWRSGFYHIAVAAQVPIVFCSIDYPGKTVKFHPPFTPTGNYAEDAPVMAAHFNKVMGKHRGISPII